MRSEEVILKGVMKKNITALAKHHKRTCDGEHCNISLLLLKLMAERAGITFTEKQKETFI